MIFIILFKLIIFWGILIFFGWNLTKVFLRESKMEFLIPFSTTLGSMVYIFLLNGLGYFFNIAKLFYIVLIFLLLIGIFLWETNGKNEKTEWSLDKKWSKIFIICALIIFISTGLVATRGYAGDELNIFSTVPMASTISQGGFPVYWTVNPGINAYYHYGVELFTASIFKTTGLPLWFGVDLCRAVFTALFFMLLFAILFQAVKNPAKALLASLMAIFGGGFIFLYLTEGIGNFYRIFFLNETILYPWKFLHNGTTSGVAGPLIKDIHIQFMAPSFLLIVSGVWLYFKSINFKLENKNLLTINTVIINILILSCLALVGETFLLVVLIAFLAYPFLMLLFKDKKKYFKDYLIISVAITVITFLIATFQGGVLTELFRQHYDRSPGISTNWFYYSYEKLGYIWSMKSIMNFGLPLFLFLPGLYLFLTKFKRDEYYNEIGQIILISIGCFAIPFVIVLGPLYDYEMARYLYLAPPFWSMMIGLILADVIFNDKTKKYLKQLSYLAIIVIVLNGVLFQLVFIIIPIGRTQERFSPFFFNFEKPKPVEAEAYEWIKENTDVRDNFWSYSSKENFSELNKKLIIFTGRVAPQYDYLDNHRLMNRDERTKKLVSEYQELEKTCQPEQIKNLNYKYLYVNQYWTNGLEERCLQNNNLELKFEAADKNEFARIYKINFK